MPVKKVPPILFNLISLSSISKYIPIDKSAFNIWIIGSALIRNNLKIFHTKNNIIKLFILLNENLVIIL